MDFRRAVLTQFVELQGRHYPPETTVWIVEEHGEQVTIEAPDGRRGPVHREALGPPPPPPPDDRPRAPAGKYRVRGQDHFSPDDPPYVVGDFDTLDEAREAQRRSCARQADAGDLADGVAIFDDRGRIVF